MKPLSGQAKPWLAASVSLLFLASCSHDSGPAPTTVKKWDAVELHASYEVPAPAGRTEEGDLTLELLSDNSLKYDFHLHNLAATDALSGAHIHFGDAGTAGPVLINLNPVFTGAAATGIVTNLRAGQIDTLLHMPVYFNVHSNQAIDGIARAQLDKTVAFAADIALNGDNEAPNPITTTATGTCILRLTEDETLYSKISVSNLEANDTLTAAHIHRGATGATGPIRINLALGENDFGVLKTTQLPDSLYQMLRNDPVYVNAHSKRHGSGIIRGQVR